MTKHLALVTFVFLLFFIVNARNPSTFLPQKHATINVKDPILVVTGKDNGTVDEWSMWFKGNGTYIYQLCTIWDGPVGGTPSTELFALRGSIQGLKIGEQLQFYVASGNCSVVGSDENSAETYSIGDGLFETVYRSPGGGYTRRDKPPVSSSDLPPSAFAKAKRTPRATGAVLPVDAVPGAHCGEESLYVNSTSPTIRITISNAELATWDRLEKSVSKSGPGMDGNGTYTYSVTVTASLPDQGGVEIIGCTDIGEGEESVVTAKANKEGGTYRFWAEPQDMFAIETNGSSATLRGSFPARGTLYVEYTGADGKKAEAKKEAASVNVESYNDGQKIPQIPLFDIDGKKLDGILKVPVEIKPKDAADLLSYIPADPGVLTAVGLDDVVTIQGIRPGITTIQATTDCGINAGPAVDVEVVNCDDETIATLERMKKAALENLVEATNEMQRVAGSPEFEKARDELVSSTQELLAKAALTIIANGKSPTKVIDVAAEIADKGAALSEVIASSNPEEMKDNIGKTAAGDSFEKIVEKKFSETVSDLCGKSLSAAFAIDEVQKAAKKFGDNVGEILKHDDVMKGLMDNYEQAMRNFALI